MCIYVSLVPRPSLASVFWLHFLHTAKAGARGRPGNKAVYKCVYETISYGKTCLRDSKTNCVSV